MEAALGNDGEGDSVREADVRPVNVVRVAIPELGGDLCSGEEQTPLHVSLGEAGDEVAAAIRQTGVITRCKLNPLSDERRLNAKRAIHVGDICGSIAPDEDAKVRVNELVTTDAEVIRASQRRSPGPEDVSLTACRVDLCVAEDGEVSSAHGVVDASALVGRAPI